MKASAAALVLWAAVLPFTTAGCGLFRRHPPQPPAVVILQAPILLPSLVAEPPMPPPPDYDPVALEPLPAFPPAAVAARPPLPPRRPPEEDTANRGDHAAPAPAAAPPPPLTSLTPGEQDSYRRAAMAALNNAQRDLRALYNRRNLDARAVATRAQADEYVRQAQQALAQGDLLRAQTLADKAETLARFLLGR